MVNHRIYTLHMSVTHGCTLVFLYFALVLHSYISRCTLAENGYDLHAPSPDDQQKLVLWRRGWYCEKVQLESHQPSTRTGSSYVVWLCPSNNVWLTGLARPSGHWVTESPLHWGDRREVSALILRWFTPAALTSLEICLEFDSEATPHLPVSWV